MAAKDAIDVWKELRDYITSRLKQRYQTIDEAKSDMNRLFEYAMQTVQENYDRFFDKEIFANLDVYNIEILGEQDQIIPEDELVEESEDGVPVQEGNDNDMFADEENDVPDEEINKEFDDELR